MKASAPPTALTREQFLACVRASGILTDRQFERAELSVGDAAKSAREVAEQLVCADWLTRFQAERLLNGRREGFLLGPYVVLDYLAKTAAGRLYRAKHRTMNRSVAVLVLPAGRTATEAVREGIRVHARAAARLAHPNVLTLLDVNTAGERMYLVQEFVAGADAAAMVQSAGPMGIARGCEFVRQAALGLQHAHDKRIPHGRLSPAALHIGRPGGTGPESKPVVKLCGLGLGTLDAEPPPIEYLAPELASDPTPTFAADLFALGAVLHFLLTARPPHPATPLQVLRRDIPPPLAAIIHALLHPEPLRRPHAAVVVANALAAFADDASALIDFSHFPAVCAPTSPSTSGVGSVTLPTGIPLAPPPHTPGPFDSLPTSNGLSASRRRQGGGNPNPRRKGTARSGWARRGWWGCWLPPGSRRRWWPCCGGDRAGQTLYLLPNRSRSCFAASATSFSPLPSATRAEITS